jgi:hypothetical protein
MKVDIKNIEFTIRDIIILVFIIGNGCGLLLAILISNAALDLKMFGLVGYIMGILFNLLCIKYLETRNLDK